MKNGNGKSHELRIEKGIPVPAARSKGATRILRSLKSGESVLLPLSQRTASATASYALGAGGYATRAEDGGTRVWRR